MDNISHITAWVALVAYTASAVVLLKSAKTSDDSSRTVSYRFPAFTGIAFHAVSAYTMVVHESALTIGFFSALSLTSLLIAILLIAVSFAQSIEILGVVLFPIAGACALAGVLNPTEVSSTAMNLQWHILTSVMAYGMLALAATQAVALAIQTHHLRNLQPQGILAALPPINLMEKLLFQMVGVGFFLLSLSLLTGVLFLDDIFAQHLVHKTTLTIMGWLVFGALLGGRLLWGWRGKTALIYTLSGLGFLIVGYFGSKLVLEFILAR